MRIPGWPAGLLLTVAAAAAACGDDGDATTDTTSTTDSATPGDGTNPGDGDGQVTNSPDGESDSADPGDTAGDDTNVTNPDATTTSPDVADTSEPGDTVAVIASGTIVFPPESGTTAESIIVRGTASAAGPILGVSVAGQAATSDDDFAHWQVTVPLSLGANPMPLVVNTADGNFTGGHGGVTRWPDLDDEAAKRGSGEWPGRALGLSWDPVNANVALSDDVGDGSYAVDPVSGDRTIVSYSESNRGPGVGYEIVQPTAIAASGASLWVADRPYLVHIDIASGDRTLLPIGELSANGLAIDPRTDPSAPHLLVLSDDALIDLDPVEGTKVTISGDGVGSGPALTNAIAMTVDANGRTAYVLRVYQDAVIAIDLADGSRSDALADGTPRFDDPRFVAWVDGALAVWNQGALYRVDLGNGSRKRLDHDAAAGVELRGVNGMAGSPFGLLAIDYVPDWEEPPERLPMLFAVDPIVGTRVILAK